MTTVRDVGQRGRYPIEPGLLLANVEAMISHPHKCIFVHVPKTAGQSIEHVFLRLHGLSWKDRQVLLLRQNPDPSMGPKRLAHLYASEYVSCGHLEEERFDTYFKFAFVRNPWDRLASEYQFRTRFPGSFREFVIQGFKQSDPYADTYRHLAPQVHYLFDSAGKCQVNFIGRFENLQDDFAQVCTRLGLPDQELPHTNRSPRRPALSLRRKSDYRAWYDPWLRQLVAERYAADIELFDYGFGSDATGLRPLTTEVKRLAVRPRRQPALSSASSVRADTSP